MESLVCLAPPCVDGAFTTLDMVRVAVACMLAILFLQSGIDKVVDRAGNVKWLIGHFSKSFLASQVVPMLSVLTVVELAAGAVSAFGAAMLLIDRSRFPAALGAALAVAAFLMLFFGQRVAKDYAGAAALVPYFVLALAGLGLMGLP